MHEVIFCSCLLTTTPSRYGSLPTLVQSPQLRHCQCRYTPSYSRSRKTQYWYGTESTSRQAKGIQVLLTITSPKLYYFSSRWQSLSLLRYRFDSHQAYRIPQLNSERRTCFIKTYPRPLTLLLLELLRNLPRFLAPFTPIWLSETSRKMPPVFFWCFRLWVKSRKADRLGYTS